MSNQTKMKVLLFAGKPNQILSRLQYILRFNAGMTVAEYLEEAELDFAMEEAADAEVSDVYVDYDEPEEERGEEPRYCPNCGEELVPGSISYYEGFHIDSCI